MSRVKRGTTANKRRKKVLSYTKGFRYGRKSKYRLAKEALIHAWVSAFRNRRLKKREQRKLWQVKINAFCHQEGLNYSKFTKLLRDKNILLNRKMLAEIAEEHPLLMKKIFQEIQAK